VGIKIIKPGLLTTIQDKGRFGYRKEGIIVSGAMDGLALRIGNLLTGNDETAAGLEITQQGPVLFFEEPQLIAITGADLSPTINQQPVPLWRPVHVTKGSVLEFGKLQRGCRAYISFAGGLTIPPILGSLSPIYVQESAAGKAEPFSREMLCPSIKSMHFFLDQT
jgi:antagonist of KipI